MNCGKYIILNLAGHEYPVLFSYLLPHDIFGFSIDRIISAGFFEAYGCEEIDSGEIFCHTFGESVSLSISSRKEEDSRIIKKFLSKGY